MADIDLSTPQPNARQASLLRLSAALGAINQIALWLAATGLVVMTCFVAYQVFSRYVLNASPSWTEPASIMLMSWFIFLGSAVGVRENYHLGFDVLLYVLPRGSKAVLRTISDVVVLAFGLAMVWFGSQLVGLTWATKLPSIGLPGGFSYLPVVGGGVLIALFSLERIVLRAAGLAADVDLTDPGI